jgi:hypothetical protein
MPETTVERVTARSKYKVVHLVDDVVWFHFEGFLAAEFWPPTEKLLEGVIAQHGRALMLGNGLYLDGYEPAYRQDCTRWFVRRRGKLRGVHLLVRSRIVRMGVQVVNLAVPVIEGYDDPAVFMEHACALVPRLATYLHRAGLESPGGR